MQPPEISEEGTRERKRGEGEGRERGARSNVLLSIRYGIPNTKARPTRPIRIMGFFSRVTGETLNGGVC